MYQVTVGNTGSLFGAGGGVNASSSQAVFSITTDPDDGQERHHRRRYATRWRRSRMSARSPSTARTSRWAATLADRGAGVAPTDPARAQERPTTHVLDAVKAVDGLADVTLQPERGPAVGDRRSSTRPRPPRPASSPATLSQYTTLLLNGYPLGIVPTRQAPIAAQLCRRRACSPLPRSRPRQPRQAPRPGRRRHWCRWARSRTSSEVHGAGPGLARRRRAHGDDHRRASPTTTSARPPRTSPRPSTRSSCPPARPDSWPAPPR